MTKGNSVLVNLDQLVERLAEEEKGNFDKRVLAGEIKMLYDGETLMVEDMPVKIGETAERNLGERLGIPARTLFNLFKDDLIDLRVTTFNRVVTQKLKNVEWFCRLKNKSDGIIFGRAFLSKNYVDASNIDVVYAVADALTEVGGFITYDAYFSEKEFWVRFIVPDIRLEIKKGEEKETWVGAVRVCNSEVGHRAASVIAHIVKEDETDNGFANGITFAPLKDTRAIHRGTSTCQILNGLSSNVPKVLSELENYLWKLDEFSQIEVKEPLAVFKVIGKENPQITKKAVEGMKLAWIIGPGRQGHTGIDVINSIINAPQYASLQWEDELYLERLAAKMVRSGKLI